jgi:hypothetical protein
MAINRAVSLRIDNEANSPTGNDWWRNPACWYFGGHVGASATGKAVEASPSPAFTSASERDAKKNLARHQKLIKVQRN